MSEPTTAAGRALLDEWWPQPDRHDPESIERMDATAAILAIEAEAAAGQREALLDVALLRKAFDLCGIGAIDGHLPSTWAVALAAEYARLAASEPGESEGAQGQ